MLHHHPPADPHDRGYFVSFHPLGPNICPGCGGDQWFVGRSSAECAYCATALPLVENLCKAEWLPVTQAA